MSNGDIRDIASYKELNESIQGMLMFKRLYPWVRPLLRMLKADVGKLDEIMPKLDELSRMKEELISVPERFNKLFPSRGWIMYERMDVNVAEAAIERAEAGDWDGADEKLVAYHDGDTLRYGLMAMHSVHAFRPRLPLAQKALEDHEAGRYHASVPVVLALLDGMVNEIHQKVHGVRRGISSEGVDLEAWDSLAGHGTGLNQLVKIFQTGRRKTTQEPITLPYRNGIMHGIDLGYANQTVSAKVWAALFAAREWAVKAESGNLRGPPPKPKPSLRQSLQELSESLQQYRETQAVRARLDEWKPRTILVGRDVPETGEPEAFGEGTPERKLAEYLYYWSKKNYGYMARCIAFVHGPRKAKAAAQVRSEFADRYLQSFKLVALKDTAPSLREIEAVLDYDESGKQTVRTFSFRMLFEAPDGSPGMPGETGAEWKVVNWGLY